MVPYIVSFGVTGESNMLATAPSLKQPLSIVVVTVYLNKDPIYIYGIYMYTYVCYRVGAVANQYGLSKEHILFLTDPYMIYNITFSVCAILGSSGFQDTGLLLGIYPWYNRN